MQSNLGLLDRLFNNVSTCFNEQSARALVTLRADEKSAELIQELADRSREGKLSPEEQRQYESYAQAVSFVSVLQAKARHYLRELGKGS